MRGGSVDVRLRVSWAIIVQTVRKLPRFSSGIDVLCVGVKWVFFEVLKGL